MEPARQPADRDQVREAVRSRYSGLARAAQAGESVTDCDPGAFAAGGFGAAGYPDVGGLPGGAARASLGCGNPVAVADLCPGETVLDLGSGGGIDVLLSARRVGPSGFAYGVDMTDEMLTLARANAVRAGAQNVEFLKGEIEALPLPDASVDVVISNCVINLSTDKPAVLAEMYRVLVLGGSASPTWSPMTTCRPPNAQPLAPTSAASPAPCPGRSTSTGSPRRGSQTRRSPSPTRQPPACTQRSSGPSSPPPNNRGPGTATGHRLASWPGPSGTAESLPDRGQAYGAIRHKVRVLRSPCPRRPRPAAQAGGQVRTRPPGAVPGARRDRPAGPVPRRSCPGRQLAPGREWTSALPWPRRVPRGPGRRP